MAGPTTTPEVQGAVERMKERLTALGYDPGTTDEQFRSAMSSALSSVGALLEQEINPETYDAQTDGVALARGIEEFKNGETYKSFETLLDENVVVSFVGNMTDSTFKELRRIEDPNVRLQTAVVKAAATDAEVAAKIEKVDERVLSRLPAVMKIVDEGGFVKDLDVIATSGLLKAPTVAPAAAPAPPADDKSDEDDKPEDDQGQRSEPPAQPQQPPAPRSSTADLVYQEQVKNVKTALKVMSESGEIPNMPPLGEMDGPFDAAWQAAFYHSIAYIKLGLITEGVYKGPADGTYNAAIGQKLKASIMALPEEKRSEFLAKLETEGRSGEENLTALMVSMDALAAKGNINIEAGKQSAIDPQTVMMLQLANHIPDEWKVKIGELLNSLGPIGQLIALLVENFMGIPLTKMLSPENAPTAATLNERLQNAYQEALAASNGDPDKLKENLMDGLKELGIAFDGLQGNYGAVARQIFTSERSTLEKFAEEALDKAKAAAGNGPKVFADAMEQAIREQQAAQNDNPSNDREDDAPGADDEDDPDLKKDIRYNPAATGSDPRLNGRYDNEERAAKQAYEDEIGLADSDFSKMPVGIHLPAGSDRIILMAYNQNGELEAKDINLTELGRLLKAGHQNPDDVQVHFLQSSAPERVGAAAQKLKSIFAKNSGGPEPKPEDVTVVKRKPVDPSNAEVSLDPGKNVEELLKVRRGAQFRSDINAEINRGGDTNGLQTAFTGVAVGGLSNPAYSANVATVTGNPPYSGPFSWARQFRQDGAFDNGSTATPSPGASQSSSPPPSDNTYDPMENAP